MVNQKEIGIPSHTLALTRVDFLVITSVKSLPNKHGFTGGPPVVPN